MRGEEDLTSPRDEVVTQYGAVSPETIYTQQQKHPAGCIYIFVHIYVTIVIKENKTINLRIGAMEVLEGGLMEGA